MDADASLLLFLFQSVETSIVYSPLSFGVELLVFILFLIGSGFVSGSEVALFSLDAADIAGLKASSNKSSQRVLRLLSDPEALLVTILVLNNVFNVAAVTLAAVMTLQLASIFLWSKTVVIVAEIVIVTFVLLIIGEMTPKLTAVNNPVKYSELTSSPLVLMHRLIGPFSRAVSGFVVAMQSHIPEGAPLSADDVKRIAEVGEERGDLAEEERELIDAIVELGDTAVREIMVSRMDIVAIPDTASFIEVLDVIRASGHSRLPMYKGDLDTIEGVIYAKDLIPFLGEDSGDDRVDWQPIVRRPLIVPTGKKLDSLLREFQSRRTHVAIVVDEYGGTAGLVTLEDVLEEIVGDIRDEYDLDEQPLWRLVGPLAISVDAKIDLDELNEVIEELFGVPEKKLIDTEQFDFETVGGLIFHLTESIPSPGHEVTYENLCLTVETVDNHRIGRVRVRLIT